MYGKNPANVQGERDRNGNHRVNAPLVNSSAMSCHGKSASKKSFDQLAAEKGIKTFRKV